MSSFTKDAIVRYWPGVRPGRTEVATVISDGIVAFGGAECVRIQQATGGTDYIAVTHVEQIGRIDGRRAYVKTAREAVAACMLDVDDVVVEDRADALMLQKLARAFP
jgi:hypothetical protein